jgi:predicted aspartyl protease
MRKNSKIILLVLLQIGIVLTALAQKPKYKYPDFGYHIYKNKASVRFPFRFVSNLIVVPVQINNSDTLNFVLDTGVSNLIVTDPSLASQIKLIKTRNIKVAGAGQGDAQKAYISTGNTVKMGCVQGKSQNVIVLESDFLEISQILGMKIHGLIGYDIFNYFVVNIDFTSGIITLYQPERYKYRPSKGELFSIDIIDSKPYINDISIEINDKTINSRLMIDTGAGHAVSIEISPSENISLPEKTITAQLGKGLNGSIVGHLGRIKKVIIGKSTHNDVLGSFPDTSSIITKLSHTVDRNGTLGCEILKRYSVTFNYRENYLLLKPNPSRMRETYEHNMSGLELLAQGEMLDKIMINKIEPDSPADLAGFKEGDQIIAINNKKYGEESLSEIYKILQNKEGRQIQLLVKRDEALYFNTFTLKRLI